MLSVRPKITDHNFHLFARNLHPELFEVCANRRIERTHYQLELNITPDGHLIVFRHDGIILSEVCSALHHPLPESENIFSRAIGNHFDNDIICDGKVSYRTEVAMEKVPTKMFVSIQQQLNPKVECEGLVHRFESNGRIAFGAFSYIHLNAYSKHVCVRSFHTFPDTSSILKSESTFTVPK
ncbi:MAG: DUF2617 family protein [Planctomycetota bacterium]